MHMYTQQIYLQYSGPNNDSLNQAFLREGVDTALPRSLTIYCYSLKLFWNVSFINKCKEFSLSNFLSIIHCPDIGAISFASMFLGLSPSSKTSSSKFTSSGTHRRSSILVLGQSPKTRIQLQVQGRIVCGGLPGEPQADCHGKMQSATGRLSGKPSVHFTSGMLRSTW